MSTGSDLRTKNIFEPIPNEELQEFNSSLRMKLLTMVGRYNDGSVVVFKPETISDDLSLFRGVYRTSTSINDTKIATFTLILDDNKYLFKALLKRSERRRGELELKTQIFRIQRRAVKRTKIPSSFYSSLRLTHHNNRLVRTFGKMMDISTKGIGILMPKDTRDIKPGDMIKAVLTISQRPPELLEMKVIHILKVSKIDPVNGEKIEGVLFGAQFLPENSNSVVKQMTSMVNEIHRDLFSSFTSNQKQ